MADLPEDLDRLGHLLTRAAERAAVRRRRAARRRRLVACAAAATLVFAATTPAHLDTADQPELLALTITPASAAVRCDQPRGQRFRYTEACDDQRPAPQAAR